MAAQQPPIILPDNLALAQARIVDLELQLQKAQSQDHGSALSLNSTLQTNGALTGSHGHKRVDRQFTNSEELLRLAFHTDLLETMSDAVIALDSNLCIRYCNAAAEHMYDVRRSDVIGKPLLAMHGYAFLAPEDEQRSINDLLERGSWKGEYIHILKNGTQVVVNSTVNVLPPESGGGMVAVIRDFTRRKQEELERQNHASQLARANEDLLHFAYAVSHDLQAPLRTITSFSQLLALKYKQQVDAQGGEFLRWIIDASTRMDTMLRDLLQFAKVAGGEAEFSPDVALSGSFATALESLRSIVEETQAVITHDSLPVVTADAGQLVQLFQNLIGNSLKYRKAATPPRIHVSAQHTGTEWVVAVRDNGLGFDRQHSERIFGVFQRLHGKDFAGTGIGLTIAKRIVERRGGRIWAVGEPDQGATFSFSIPDSTAAVQALPPMDFASLHTVLENRPLPAEPVATSSHFDELFKTLDLAQAVVRRLDGTILIWTKGAERLFGWTEAQALGKQLHELIATEFPESQTAMEAALRRDGSWTGELKARKRDGSVVWLASHNVLHLDGGNRPQSVIEVHNDITALKAAEAAVRRSGEQRDLALSAGRMGTWRWESRTGVVEWSPTLEALLGMPPGSFEGTFEAFQRRSHPDDRQHTQQNIAKALESGGGYSVENRLLRNDGSYCWVRGQGKVIFDEHNQPAGLIGVVWDIGERKQSEADRQFLLDLSAKLSQASNCSQLTDLAVKEVVTYFGLSRSTYSEIDQPGKRFQVLSDCHAEGPSLLGIHELDEFDGVLAEMAANRFVAVSDIQTDPRTAHESETYLSFGVRAFLSVPLHREGAWVASLSVTNKTARIWEEREIALLRSISERLWPALENARLLQETRERQEQFENTFEQAAVGLSHVALDGRWLRVNERLCQITGYTRDELLQGRFQDITHPDDLDIDLQHYEALKRGESQSYAIEKRYFHKNGSTVWVNLTVSLVRDQARLPKYAISVVEDITSRRITADGTRE